LKRLNSRDENLNIESHLAVVLRSSKRGSLSKLSIFDKENYSKLMFSLFTQGQTILIFMKRKSKQIFFSAVGQLIERKMFRLFWLQVKALDGFLL